MKTYSAKKEIRIMGIALLIFGFLNIITYTPGLNEKFPDAIFLQESFISIFLGGYGLMHIFNLNRFK